ncbi:MAG: 4Fe-4S dicluster domain-containing protein [Ruminococcaceae bacterium]|nr:4Fe-4S dicluster domain-containing protein [Oscillospiraceae bacterium]
MDKTINQVSHDQCTGCGACYNKCPTNAIVMEYDEEGFIFPKVTDTCVNCGLCQNVCPALNPLKFHDKPASYAVWAADDVRLKSSSGGMFSLLADYVLEHGGAVCGAAYTDDYQFVHHIWAEYKADLAPLRGSKYVQSDTELTYRQAKQYLDQGRMVLYTGCPCQIAGLYGYLGKEYENLYTADLVCHGSNSVTAYQSFIKEFSEGKEIAKVDFRDKVHYTWSTPTVVYLKNGEVKKAAWNEGMWYKGFLDGIINRTNCYSCPYARAERIADITMADCWQVHRHNPSYDDRKGTSLVLVNSKHGQKLFQKLRSRMKLCEPIPLDFMSQFNGQLRHPTPPHPSRKFFFSHLKDYGYHKALWYGRGMRYDVGIVGWWFASNYGSSLTYYALGTILENLGKQVLMVPIAKVNGTPWEPEIKYTVDFLSQFFHIGKTRSFDKMYEFNQFCDSFMLGSDQMWTGGSTDLVGYTFFLDFVDKDKKKIAFSTSFGQSDFYASDEVRATAGDFLKRFDAISVREKSGIDVCKKRFGIDADQIIDPVFLCTKEDYNRVADKVHDVIDRKYLLCYILDPTPEKEAAARAIAEHENLEIITILGLKEHNYAINNWHVGTILPRITSSQFLYYIKNCSYLMTDSHHGTCFGIIYEKPYAAIGNASRGITRFETVADALGLRDRLFLNPDDICNSDRAYAPIDYVAVNRCIHFEKERAMAWLENALVCPTKAGIETMRTLNVDHMRKFIGMSNRVKALESENEKYQNDIANLRKEIDNYLNTGFTVPASVQTDCPALQGNGFSTTKQDESTSPKKTLKQRINKFLNHN